MNLSKNSYFHRFSRMKVFVTILAVHFWRVADTIHVLPGTGYQNGPLAEFLQSPVLSYIPVQSPGTTEILTEGGDFSNQARNDEVSESRSSPEDSDDARTLDAVPAIQPLIARADLVAQAAAVPTDYIGSVTFFQRFLAVPMYVVLSFKLADNTITSDSYRVEIRTGGAIDLGAGVTTRCTNVGSRYTNPLRQNSASLLSTTLRVNQGRASAIFYNVPGGTASLFGKYNIRNRIVAVLDGSGAFQACGDIRLV